MMKEMITHGINARAIETNTAKSRAWVEATREENTKNVGKGAEVTSNLIFETTFANTDSYRYW